MELQIQNTLWRRMVTHGDDDGWCHIVGDIWPFPARHVGVAPFIVNNNRKQWRRAGARFPQLQVGFSLARRSRTNAGSQRSHVPGAAQHLKGVHARLCGLWWCAADPGPFQSVAVPDQRCTASHSARAAPRPGHTISSDAFVALFTCQTAHLVPATRFCARALQLCFTNPESRGGRSAEKRSGACEAPVGPAHDAAGPGACEAPCVP